MKNLAKIAVLFLSLCQTQLSFAEPRPIAPTDKNGRGLNLDFEDGTLRDWVTDGNAFAQQPVRGDTVSKRNGPGGTSGHQGEFWIGGYENVGDDAIGKLTSAPFKVTQRWASFLVAGGNWDATCVDLVEAKSGKTFSKISGDNSEHLRRAVVDLEKQIGQEIFIRLVDEQKGGWGHLNFDDFKFYAERPKFADEIDLSKKQTVPEADAVLYEGLSPEDAVAKMTLPPGFKATLFAGEPDVMQPIAFAIDDRGRLWVAEAYTYPKRAKEGEGKDRILVLEDTDGDGKFNKRTVFMEGMNLISGIELGFGGVYVGAAPYLMFIPIADGDEPKPAGKPEILLDGWDYERDTHETLNSFKWGPDGWLYGCHGVFCPSLVGKPGAPESERQWVDAAIWRYHPTKKIFEIFAEGTSNPWGFDFDERGQLFEEACVIPHLFHMIQGGRYQRQGGEHFTINSEETARNEKNRDKNSRKPIFPYFYDDIKTVADHVHYAGDKGPHAGNGRSDSAGGGHAHAGLMIYQGDNWPHEYRGKIFIGNIHGQRINMDIPERKGSGFVAKHGKDMINFNDKWSQVINFQTGPDGAVYFIDWYDKNQCHHNNESGHDRNNGRIYKVYETSREKEVAASFEKEQGKPLTEESKKQLVFPRLQQDIVKLNQPKESLLVYFCFHFNEWHSRHARQILQEHAQLGKIEPATITTTREFLGLAPRPKVIRWPGWKKFSDQSEIGCVRLLWDLHVTAGINDEDGLKLLGNKFEYVRAWTIQLLCEDKNVSPEILKEFNRLAREDKSPVVRLYLASALQRLPLENRWEILESLYAHPEDVTDHNLPLMIWYAAEPLATVDTKRALQMAEATQLPNILNFTVRRTAAIGTAGAMGEIVDLLVAASQQSAAIPPEKNQPRSAEAQLRNTLEILNGLSTALKGQRSAPMPRGWELIEKKFSENPNVEIRAQVQSLSLTFGSSSALASLKKTLMDSSADINARRTALDSLLNAKDSALAPLLQKLLADSNLQGPALRGLAAYDDAQTPEKILQAYNSFNEPHKRDALNTLASRAAFAKPLLTAVGEGKISRKDLSADLIRQLRNLKNDELNQQLEKVWGAVRETSADKQKDIEKYKKIYRAGGSQPGDASRGRAVYAKTCQQCHTLFDTGGKVGPDLTGSNRSDVDYILQNMVDPNAVMPNEYRASTLETKDDRVITGIVKTQDDNSVTMITANETVTIPRKEIQSLKQNDLSMMPEGLLDALSEQEVRDLIYYLRQPGQVPMAAGQ